MPNLRRPHVYVPLIAAIVLLVLVGASLLVNRPLAGGPGGQGGVQGGQGGSQINPSDVGPTPSLAALATPNPTPAPTPTPEPTPIPTPIPKVVRDISLEPEELTGYVWPLRYSYVTSRFGQRDFGGFIVIDGKEYHDGLDLWTPRACGDKVRAAHDGTVLHAGRNFDVYLGYEGDAAAVYARLDQRGSVKSLPYVVVIDDGNGYRSIYVHLDSFEVETGQAVKAGDVIGREGKTGYATGCHLHYGLIRMDGGWQQVVPSLVKNFAYPPLVRERIDPLRVLPWNDEFAPLHLQEKWCERNGCASPAPTSPQPDASPGVSAEPTASPAN
jgi:murein DD-endopeptidase MepM/ murein hydrolase activator NlpD